MMKWIKRLVILIVVLGLIGGAAYGAWYYLLRGRGEAVTYRTAPVKRADLLATISSTGTVEPEEVVDVGAQVAGQINSFGKDKDGKTVDYGSAVEEGTILAQIDESLYASDVAQAMASLAQANATVKRSEADLGQMKAKLDQALRDWERAQKLGPSEALAQTQYDAYKSGFEVAQANLAVGEATIVQGKAAIDQAQAALGRVKRNLGYCTIKSPVKGVIIARRVNIGQTVVSSLNAPSLFLIAKDLKRMQIWVPVNEADIGNIYPGQPVTFTADAFPGRTFKGEVGQIRLDAQSTQNVVTYTVVVITDNSDGKLLPYLTANIQFELARKTAVLQVPNSALRWYPASADQVVPEARAALAESGKRGPGGGEKGGGRAAEGGKAPTAPEGKEPAGEKDKRPAVEEGKASTDEKGKRPGGEEGKAPAGEKPKRPAGEGGRRSTAGTLWVLEGTLVKPLKVRVGLTDGTNTEVSGEDLTEGLEVVIGEQQAQAAAKATSPFTPQLFQRPKQ